MLKNIFIFILFWGIKSLHAQYIIIDPDGSTNIRKSASAKSEIIGKVQEYQVFYLDEDIPCYEGPVGVETKNWLPITVDMQNPSGYIYKSKIMSLENLPKDSVYFFNPSENNHTLKIGKNGVSLTITLGLFDQTLFTKNFFGTPRYGLDGARPEWEIKTMTLEVREKVYHIDKKGFEIYYEPHVFKLYIGKKNDVYLLIAGADGAAGYSVILSIVDGEIKYNIPMEC